MTNSRDPFVSLLFFGSVIPALSPGGKLINSGVFHFSAWIWWSESSLSKL